MAKPVTGREIGAWLRRSFGGDGRDDTGGIAWIGLLLFLGLCAVGGGSNLPSAPGLVLLWPMGILLTAGLLVSRELAGDRSQRVPVLLLASLTASIAVQLIPLPPSLWLRLPGRGMFAGLSTLIDDRGVWRPISLTPGITWSSLLATVTGWVVVLAIARLPNDRVRALTGIIILIALASCVIGLLQLIGGRDSAFYLYRSDGSIPGLLSNRNHQATLLAMTLPLLRVWVIGAKPDARLRRGAMAILLGGLMLGMIVLTGSRSGLVLALVGAVAAYTIAPERRPARRANERQSGDAGTIGAIAKWGARWGRWALIALPVLVVAGLVLTGRDLSIQRVANADYTDEIRLRSLPTTLALVETYFPVGSGYGSFDTVFRIDEPDALLKPTFFNHAHNDFLELAITGGLFPLVLLTVFAVWAVRMGWHSFRRPWREDGVLVARAGTVMVAILTLASVSDYPTRAPLMAAVGAIAVCWMARAGFRPEVGR